MYKSLPSLCGRVTLTLLVLAAAPAVARAAEREQPYDVPLKNASFTEGVDKNADKNGVPHGWSRYGGRGTRLRLSVVPGPGNRTALQIADGDAAGETGVTQAVALKEGESYQVSAQVCAVKGTPAGGAYLQLRFLPSNQIIQTSLDGPFTDRFFEVAVKGTAPPGTTKGVVYLYTHRDPTPTVLVTDVRIMGGVRPPFPAPPDPVPPQYDRLKQLHRDIVLVANSKAHVAIVVPESGIYDAAAAVIQRAIETRTGTKVAIVSDQSATAVVPIERNLIVLGNRSTNKTIAALYDRYYCLVDLKYPGPEGFVIRTVHNLFANGSSVVVVGGSDVVGVDAGAEALGRVLAKRKLAGAGDLSIGWTMETKLGRGVVPPTDIKDFETWEASRGYGSMGYFGWCSISKHMAMYYMTGNERNAREFVRLAFPDPQAIRDIERIDGERIENKRDPLAGFYHYNAHMAILFWDLIEESPVFTDDERLRITNAFARQLEHRKGEGVYGLTQARSRVGSRHGQWSAISLYCLGRYFDKYYPDPIWAQCQRAGKLAFGSLHRYAWVEGESDNLFWYSTGIAPVFTYMVLTGDRKPLENGVIQQLLLGQQALISGRAGDWALRSASVGMLNKVAYLTGDGRWSTYRDRTGVDTNLFRLGQSFWPDESIEPVAPSDLVDRWTVFKLPKPAWDWRGSGLPFEQSFYFGSYRSAPDGSGDYILLDGFNGASRNPYHTFSILQLRIDGRTILDGYHNQILTSADAMVEPAVAMDAALLHADVVGPTAIAVGEVPKAAYCNWRRTLVQRTGVQRTGVQRTGRYALVMDDLAFRDDSQNMNVTTRWQVVGGHWNARTQSVDLPAAKGTGDASFQIQSCDIQQVHQHGRIVTMQWGGAAQRGQHRFAFHLISRTPAESRGMPAIVRVADQAAALALPGAAPALAVGGQYQQIVGELVIVAGDHLVGHGLSKAELGPVLLVADERVDVDWDFSSGVAHIVSAKAVTLRMNLGVSSKAQVNGLLVDGRVVEGRSNEGGLFRFALPAGRHMIEGAKPASRVRAELENRLSELLTTARRQRREAAAQRATVPPATVPLAAAWTVELDGPVVDMVCIDGADRVQLAVAEGERVHLLDGGGTEVGQLQTDGKIRVLRWWREAQLLLVGCEDEQVIAFDTRGQRRWSFRSEMDAAVYKAAKTYWFKTAPGHAGIHGLYTGAFDDGNSRCFVGSACTLEILDRTGQLVKRTPIFWGPGRQFLLVAGPEGSKNLLVARWPNGNDRLAIVNSKKMAVVGRGYDTVPAGHTLVGGWAAQNRTRSFCRDLDGDGRQEVITAINGTWNRVTVYSELGAPLSNAQFGPGSSSTPRSRMRDLDVGDLDGDGKQEIIVGIADGLVVVLNHRCEKVWSTRLASAPFSLKVVTRNDPHRAQIVVGCEDGTVAVLDQRGQPTSTGEVNGRPEQIQTLATSAGPVVVVATDHGQVSGFQIGE